MYSSNSEQLRERWDELSDEQKAQLLEWMKPLAEWLGEMCEALGQWWLDIIDFFQEELKKEEEQ